MLSRLHLSILLLFNLVSIAMQAGGLKPEPCTIGIFYDSAGTATLDGIKSRLEKGNLPLVTSSVFHPNKTYWLYIQQKDSSLKRQQILYFDKRISHLDVYPWPYTGTISCYGGVMANADLKLLPGSAVLISPGTHGCLIKMQNQLFSWVSAKDMHILPEAHFYKNQRTSDLIQGIVQGFLWLMVFYNLLLYIRLKNKLYVSYVLYILFNSLFLLYSYGYTEMFLFPSHYKLNLTFLTFQPIGLYFYTSFLRNIFLKYCNTFSVEIDRKLFRPFNYLLLVVVLIISSTVYYRIDIYEKTYGLVNLISAAVAITAFVYFRKGINQIMRVIILGSVFMIMGGCLSLLELTQIIPYMAFYESGLVIELILFTFVLGREHVQLLESRYETLLKQNQLQLELEGKNRELVYMAMRLSAHDESIASMKTQIEGFKNVKGVSKNIKSIEAELSNYNNENLWNEFELHFNETHPDFYKSLSQQYPSLTPNELKLCAFLRLNLNTKDIANITRKSPRSIEVMRSRIRQKMELSRESNLNQILMQL